MSNQNDLIDQFAGMTSVSKDQAKFFLEMSNWDLEMAVTQYYDNNNESSGPSTPSASSSTPGLPEASSIPSSSIPTRRSNNPSRTVRSSNIRTLNDVSSQGGEDDDEPQNFFAGGEKSGMLVQDPTKRGKANNNLVDEILKKAAAGGPAPDDASAEKESKPNYFTGSGYTLGSEEEPSIMVTSEASESNEETLSSVTRYLTFWRNGFSVDDGPLLRYDDPANAAMLSSINSGRAPLSLLNVRHGQPVDVRVARRQDEDYVPPPKSPPKPFEGVGNRLGSPSVPSSPSSSSNTATVTSSTAIVTAPEIDNSQPTTSIQIRLGDGSRLVAKFNHTHTIQDIRRYIDSQRPGQRSYVLQTTFPVKQLTDETQSLKDAGLLNSVVVQRYE